MTTVFAFDRDHTVDVNPHPERDAVPLSWIRTISSRDEVSVWAIGNQRLRHEAQIPGVPELMRELDRGRLLPGILSGMLWVEWYLHRVPVLQTLFATSAPHVDSHMMPTRTERLELLNQLFDDATEYVVVDDVDLSAVEGWTHYYPWNFVSAVEEGVFDFGL